MGIFALNQRLGRIRRAVALAPPVVAVHRADDVGEVGRGLEAVVHRTLVVHRTRRVVGLEPLVAALEVGAHARLVAHRPDDDRGVVLVAARHALVALQVHPGILRLAGQRLLAVAHAVRLDVRLVEHVDAVAVAEVVPDGVVGIVARTHGVDVELLHDADILHHRSRLTTYPPSGSISWRSAPLMRTGCPLTSSCALRISTRRKPTGCSIRSVVRRRPRRPVRAYRDTESRRST